MFTEEYHCQQRLMTCPSTENNAHLSVEYPHHIIHGLQALQKERKGSKNERKWGVVGNVDFRAWCVRANLGCQPAWIWNQLKDKWLNSPVTNYLFSFFLLLSFLPSSLSSLSLSITAFYFHFLFSSLFVLLYNRFTWSDHGREKTHP